MSKLKAKDPKQARPSKPKVLIFGKPGVGKTWTSLDFPRVYYIDTEGGADLSHYTDKLHNSGGAYMGPEDGSLDFDTVIGQLEALATESHKYKTVVIDSISKLFNTEIGNEQRRLGEKDTFGASKKKPINKMRQLINWMDKVDMNVILIAHEKATWTDDKQGLPTFDCWDKLEYELHLCLQINKLGDQRYAKVRKSRLMGFPDADDFDWSYKEFAKRYGRDVIEGDVHVIRLASLPVITEIQRLVSLLKIDQTEVDKWLSKAKVGRLEEMTEEQAAKVAEFLTKKLNK
jgi:hypothetical protein